MLECLLSLIFMPLHALSWSPILLALIHLLPIDLPLVKLTSICLGVIDSASIGLLLIKQIFVNSCYVDLFIVDSAFVDITSIDLLSIKLGVTRFNNFLNVDWFLVQPLLYYPSPLNILHLIQPPLVIIPLNYMWSTFCLPDMSTFVEFSSSSSIYSLDED